MKSLMTGWNPRRTLIAGLLLIVGVNAIVLGGVSYNRSGQPDSLLSLSERELASPWRWRRSELNSGLALTLTWRILPTRSEVDDGPTYARYGGRAEWLNAEKLSELGFAIPIHKTEDDTERSTYRMQSREVFLVLEHNGPAYKAALETARQHRFDEASLLADNPGKPEFVKRAKQAVERLQREENDNS